MSDNEEINYSCQVEGENDPRASSKGVTGRVSIKYPNGDTFDGDMVKGVNLCFIYLL